MSIFPLPVFETDADPHHRDALTMEEQYALLEPPKTIVVRFGRMKLVGEFPSDGSAKPGCGSKLVARTHRGTELVEMLTTTCNNNGCGKSISRQEMLEYIENSGGNDYPFHTQGKILRVATLEDLNRQSALSETQNRALQLARRIATELALPMKIVDTEPILGGELLTIYYLSEERIDFREMVRLLAGELHTRIEMRQVGARDEARLVADYERCGQHCCCKNFLKVLKPVSMKAAKQQKATLDPLKISGRCGRLMCCLRYEDQSYRELAANLPKNGTRVGTMEGPGVVVDSKILVQLVLVRIDEVEKEIAVPLEELLDPLTCPKPGETKAKADAEAEELQRQADPLRGMSEADVERKIRPRSRERGRRPASDQSPKPTASSSPQPPHGGEAATPPSETEQPRARRDRSRRRRRGRDGNQSTPPATSGPNDRQQRFRDRDLSKPSPPREGAEGSEGGAGAGGAAEDPSKPRHRNRRRRRGRRPPNNPPPSAGPQ